MNYIGGFFISKGYDCTKNVLSQIIPNKNSAIGKILRQTGKVGEGVICGVAPHLINMSSWYLSRMTNMRVFSIIGLLSAVDSQLHSHKSWWDTANAGVLIATNTIAVADLFGLTPLETEYRIAVDSLLLLATVIGSTRAISEGTRRMFSSWNAESTKTTFKVARFVSGAILTTLGVVGIGNSFQVGTQLIRGVKIFQTLDPFQKKGILKHRAVHTLSGEKSCNAVIFNDVGKLKELSDIVPNPFSESLYEHCETRTYSVESPGEFCEALIEAKDSFCDSIDVLSLDGHANTFSLILGKAYSFLADQQEINCMKDVLSSNAQIFLTGCNTATPSYQNLTLTEKVSIGLPGRDVNGFSSFYHPMLITTSFLEGGRFLHDNHVPVNSNGLTGFSTVITKVSS